MVTVIAMGAASVLPAVADDIANNLDGDIDAVAEVMPLNVGGPNGTTTLYVTPRNGDSDNGCNFQGTTESLSLNVSSSNTAVATVSPSSVTFSNCGDVRTLTVTPLTQGSSTISVSQTSNNTGGTFNLAPATFTVNVAPPANTAPTISVAGVTAGAAYDKGSVPAATCEVTDAEDGNSSFPATLSAITGPYASDGIGSQTASCSYTDDGGLEASESETYSIVDPSAPSISYVLSPLTPDGSNGWYKGNVSLTWTVTEEDSPSSLSKTGCVDQSITSDQVETTYTCSATSAGGSADAVAVSIKRDGNGPVIVGGDVNNTTWRNTPLSVNFIASDAPAGLADSADAAFTLTAEDESADASTPTTVSKTVVDNAGNSTTRTLSALIDVTAPVVTVTGVEHGAQYGLGQVPTAGCNTTDSLSDVKTHATMSSSGGPVGSVTVTCAGAEDNAGNTGSASVTFNVVYKWTGFFQPIDNVLDQSGATPASTAAGWNKAKAGSAIPVKFSLGGNQGLAIFASDSTGTYPKSKQVTCPSGTVVADTVEEYATGTTSGLKYDAVADQYNYTWKTSTTFAGSCQRLQVKLVDGTSHYAFFQFIK